MSRQALLEADHDLWLPIIELEVVQEVGKKWPVGVLVTMFEENFLRERRFIGSEMYEYPSKD